MGAFPYHSKRGFTIIEILVVAAIVAIFSSVVLASVGQGRAKARDTQRASDFEQLQLALRLYKDAHGAYPSHDGGVTVASLLGSGADLEGYLGGTLSDPLSGDYHYDSSYDCDGDGVAESILMAPAAETNTYQNWAAVCSSSADVNGITPTSNSYVVILR